MAHVKASWARTYDPLIGAAERQRISGAKHVPALFEAEYGSDGGFGYVAVTPEGQIVGHVGGQLMPERVAFVDRLHVLPDWHGSAVALRLVEAVVAGQARRADTVELTVLVNNARAIGFYDKAGFVLAGEPQPREGLAGISALRMRLAMK
jgi:ribosomal protein S18 acetylase RimI-like enzyme